MTDRKTTLLGTLVAGALALCGCGQPAAFKNAAQAEPTLIEETPVKGFDPEGEPVIKKWSDGTIWIHFEAMPPFFAEESGTEAQFEEFETRIQEALGIPVARGDREVFIIKQPKPDTVVKAKSWLEAFHDQEARQPAHAKQD